MHLSPAFMSLTWLVSLVACHPVPLPTSSSNFNRDMNLAFIGEPSNNLKSNPSPPSLTVDQVDSYREKFKASIKGQSLLDNASEYKKSKPLFNENVERIKNPKKYLDRKRLKAAATDSEPTQRRRRGGRRQAFLPSRFGKEHVTEASPLDVHELLLERLGLDGAKR